MSTDIDDINRLLAYTYEAQKDNVYRIMRKRHIPAPDIEELVAETFDRFLKQLLKGNVRPNPDNIKHIIKNKEMADDPNRPEITRTIEVSYAAGAYLGAIAHNTATDFWNRQDPNRMIMTESDISGAHGDEPFLDQKPHSSAFMPDIPNPFDIVEQNSSSEEIQRCLEKLTSVELALVKLRIMEGEKWAKIIDEYGPPLGIKTRRIAAYRTNQALEKLKKCIEEPKL